MCSTENWLKLITSLKDDAHHPRLVWNEQTLAYLLQRTQVRDASTSLVTRVNDMCFQEADEQLALTRRHKFVSWDYDVFEVYYPLYQQMLCVRYALAFAARAWNKRVRRGLFVQPLLKELQSGGSVHILDPVSACWDLLDHACSEESNRPRYLITVSLLRSRHFRTWFPNRMLILRALRLLLLRFHEQTKNRLPLAGLTSVVGRAVNQLSVVSEYCFER
jgi:hypothetical protein